MANLECNFCGLKMRNPIGLASHNPFYSALHDARRNAEYIMKYVNLGAGFVVTGGIFPEKHYPRDRKPSGRYFGVKTKGFAKKEGFFVTTDLLNVVSRHDFGIEVIKRLKDKVPSDVAVIANMAAERLEEWPALAMDIEEAGADMVELNLGCPFIAPGADNEKKTHVVPIGKGGFSPEIEEGMVKSGISNFLGDVPTLMGHVVEETVKSVKIPVGVKMPADIGFPRLVGVMKTAVRAGAKFITSINAPISICPPDIYNKGKPRWINFDINAFCGAIGPWDRFLTYRNIGAGSLFVPEVPHAAVGGIVAPEHAVELMMLGASLIQLSSGILWKGKKIFTEFIDFLNKFMDEQGYNTINELVGLGKRYVLPFDEKTDWGVGKFCADIDSSICSKCGLCSELICVAITQKGDDYPSVKKEDCSACSLCIQVCPTGAIKLAPI